MMPDIASLYLRPTHVRPNMSGHGFTLIWRFPNEMGIILRASRNLSPNRLDYRVTAAMINWDDADTDLHSYRYITTEDWIYQPRTWPQIVTLFEYAAAS